MDDDNRICLLGFLCRENETRHAKYLQQIAGHLRGGCCVGNNVKQNLLFFVSRYLLGSGEGAMENAQSPCPWHAHMLCGRQAYKSLSTEQRGGPDGGEVSNMGSWRQKTVTSPWVTWEWLPSSFPYSILGTGTTPFVLPLLPLCAHLDGRACTS